MSIEIKMPALSPTMEHGTLARWLVAKGDRIKSGDVLAEVETDKATMELEASDDGQITNLVVAEGTTAVAVGTVLALLGTTGDSTINAITDLTVTDQGEPKGATDRETMAYAPVRSSGKALQRVGNASPLAQCLALAAGIDLGAVVGSGVNGRVVRADLPGQAHRPQAVATTEVSAQQHELVAGQPLSGIPVRTEKLTTMRRTIASRLTLSKQNAPHFYLSVRCNIDRLLRLRTDLNATLADQGTKLSVNDLLIKAFAAALCAEPDANVQFGGDELHIFERVDIAMAVAVEGGLVTPVIRDVGNLSVSAISDRSRALVQKARVGSLKPEEYQGGTATLSNLGMYGIDDMVPVLNPPQAVILGTAAGIRQPWNVGGEMMLATIMTATASFDHRAIDGATAARFIAAFRDYVENPLRFVS